MGAGFAPIAPRERERVRSERPDLYEKIVYLIELTLPWNEPPYFTSVNGWCMDYFTERQEKDQLSLFEQEQQ